MAEQGNQHRGLSEISHLFLSGLRERQMGGAAAPKRRPPGSAPIPQPQAPQPRQQESPQPTDFEEDSELHMPPVKAIIAAHLGGKQLGCARRYARSLASAGRRVWRAVIDACEVRLYRYDPQSADGAEEQPETQRLDARLIEDAINELSCDVDLWLVLVADVRAAEGRGLLRHVDRWVLLSDCEHEGVVACYRTIKGISELNPKAQLALAVLDARDEADADRVCRKLFNVCGQFLGRQLDLEPPVGEVSGVGEALVLLCEASHDKAQVAGAAHWEALRNFLDRAKGESPEPEMESKAPEPELTGIGQPATASEDPMPQMQHEAEFHEPATNTPPPPANNWTLPQDNPASEVIELSTEAGGEEGVLSAVMRHWPGDLIECPLRPPSCPQARLAIDRDRRMVLIAMARHGLDELRAIGLGYRWLVENRDLIAMAMPQFALDAHQLPHLRLLVDHCDADAEVLRPIFQVETVHVQTYRRVRWGQRTGLLLDAA